MGYDSSTGFTAESSGGLPLSMGQNIVCTIKSIQDSVGKMMAYGRQAMCVAWRDKAFIKFVIPSFPLAAVSYSPGGKLRLGECILWTVETIRLGHPASMGCKMVRTDAEDYEGIYFLSDEEVLDAVARYRDWWENRKYPRTMWTIDPCFDEPLCGSGYMWW